MAGKADGNHICSALNTMSRLQADAAEYLSGIARAMTDVTGFGLAGHLARMADASGLSAEINVAAIPIYRGAMELSEQGIRSTIWDANRAAIKAEIPDTPAADLLFDPQTAGGLLAALPATIAGQALNDIRAMGHDAALIGHLSAVGDVTLTAR